LGEEEEEINLWKICWIICLPFNPRIDAVQVKNMAAFNSTRNVSSRNQVCADHASDFHVWRRRNLINVEGMTTQIFRLTLP